MSMICLWYALSLGSPPLKREIHWMMSSRLYWGRSSSACRMLDFSSARRFSNSSSRCRVLLVKMPCWMALSIFSMPRSVSAS